MNYRIYITDLGAYNAGKLIGKWFELGELDNDELEKQIKEMLTYGEEWAIHDYELPFKVDEYANVFKLNEFFEELSALHELEQIVAFWLIDEYQHLATVDYIDAIFDAKNYMIIEADSLEELAYDEMNSLYDIPECLENYIDYKAYANDMSHYWSEFEFDGLKYYIRDDQ